MKIFKLAIFQLLLVGAICLATPKAAHAFTSMLGCIPGASDTMFPTADVDAVTELPGGG